MQTVQLHHYNKKIEFSSVPTELVEISDHVGYFVGWQLKGTGFWWRFAKWALHEIALLCDIQDADETEEAGEDKWKQRHPDFHASKRQDRKDEVDTIFCELRETHGDTYETPQLHLWTRMIQCGNHDDYIWWSTPCICTNDNWNLTYKSPKKELITDAFTQLQLLLQKHLVRYLHLNLQPQAPKCQAHQQLVRHLGNILNLGWRIDSSWGTFRNSMKRTYCQSQFIEQKQMILDSLWKVILETSLFSQILHPATWLPCSLPC